MMDLVYTAVAGMLAGFLGGKIMPGEEPGGWMGLLGFGLVGGFVGKFIFDMLGMNADGNFNIMSIVASVIGACIVIFIWKKFIGPMIGGGNNA